MNVNRVFVVLFRHLWFNFFFFLLLQEFQGMVFLLLGGKKIPDDDQKHFHPLVGCGSVSYYSHKV